MSATTDLIAQEFATAAGITEDEAWTRLASLPQESVDTLATITADTFVRNLTEAGMAPQAALDAAHRRAGLELGRAFAKAKAAKDAPTPCPNCSGRGVSATTNDRAERTCPWCHGKGHHGA